MYTIYMYVNFVAVWIIVAAEKDEAKPDKKKLEGQYIITEVAPDGEPIAPEAAAKKIHKTIWMYCQGPHTDQLQAMES